MAEKPQPNTFSGGMITDLDPAYQAKESYFTGLNVRVVTNGDSSFSLEAIQGPELSYSYSNASVSSTDRLYTHGAAIVDDYLILITKENIASNPDWAINKHTISPDGTISVGDNLWNGDNLFSEDAGRIEIESIVETETLHRIYCTDGIGGLKSINLKDSDLSSKTAEDFLAFKPNLMRPATLQKYNEVGGALKYGSYAYVYRLGSKGQGNFSDWSQISSPINIVKNSIINNTSLGISGESSAFSSSASLDVSIVGISTSFESIEVAAIHYSSENVSTISVIESGPISSSTYNFRHSGFEIETLVSGGIAAAIISNENWDSCKSLAQKDNKLYASNLKSTIFDIDDTISGFGKLKSYKGVKSGSNWSLVAHSEDLNPHRHYNGSGNNWSWHEDPDLDKVIYKFINKEFNNDTTDPRYVLGAETVGYSSGSDGFRVTFDQKSYKIDEQFNKAPDGNTALPTDDQDIPLLYTVDFSNNSEEWSGGSPGPQNPAWDNKYRSFKRGECYRLGIVFYDKKGGAGFTHYMGDIKMPDALDSNVWILNGSGNYTTLKANSTVNTSWCPFSDGSEGADVVEAHALIPRIDVRLPSSVLNLISGYKVVRAELKDDDKTIITQGVFSNLEVQHATQGDNDILRDKIHVAGHGLHATKVNSSGESTGYQARTAGNCGIIDTPDVTFRGMSYELGTGYSIRPAWMMMANKIHTGLTVSPDLNHKYFGHDVTSNMIEDGSAGTGFSVIKWKPWSTLLSSSGGATAKSAIKGNYSGSSFFRWTTDLQLVKTAVNREEISLTQSGLSMTYINQAGVYKDGEFNNADGEMHPNQYHELSRCDFSGETPTNIFVSTVGSGYNNIPGPGRCKIDEVQDKSLSHYLSNNHRSYDHTSGSPAQTFYEGFKWVAEVIRDTSSGFEQYGGSSDSDLENTRFQPAQEFNATTSASTYTSDITRGDVYCDWYTYKNSGRINANSSYQYGTAVPLESYLNVSLRHGTYLGSNDSVFIDVDDNFLYNSAYSQENNMVSSALKPYGWVTNDLFKAKVAASKPKILGELYDAWSIFPANDFIDLNLAQGKISDLVSYKNQLYAIQDRGVSLLSVNSRALIQGSGAAADIQIVTGTGTAIERFDYLSTEFGCQHYNTATKTPTGFYLLDAEKEDVIKCDGQRIIPMALSTNWKSYLHGVLGAGDIPITGTLPYNPIGMKNKGIFSGYDPRFRECYYNIVSSSGAVNSFTISDLNGSLISKQELKAVDQPEDLSIRNYITYKNSLFGIVVTENTNENIYKLNEGVYQNFNVGFIVNDNPTFTKIFDTSEIISTQEEFFTSHSLEDSGGNTILGSNERLREGTHKVVLRAEDSPKRLRGTWMKYTISYNQLLAGGIIDATTDKNFNIFAVTTNFRKSK